MTLWFIEYLAGIFKFDFFILILTVSGVGGGWRVAYPIHLNDELQFSKISNGHGYGIHFA